MPGQNWREDHTVMAHRLGSDDQNLQSQQNGQWRREKPMIVRFTRWQGKMDVLIDGTEGLRMQNVKVSGDLTKRQRSVIEDHRQRGLHAHYSGSKLVVTGPLRTASNANVNNANTCRSYRYDSDMQRGENVTDLHRHQVQQQHRTYTPNTDDRQAYDRLGSGRYQRYPQQNQHGDQNDGMVPEGLLTFLGSLYKEVAKTTPGTLVYRFERQTATKIYFFRPKTLSST